MTNIQEPFTYNGMSGTYTWIPTDSFDSYSPITQVYGVCFNEKGKILVCRSKPTKGWQLAGGTPEEGESFEETLIREMLEEANVKVKNVEPLGVSQVDFPNNPNKAEGERFYQARAICELEELLPSSPDPATGNTWERIFVPADKVTEYVHWGLTGEAMFKQAIEKHRSRH